MLGAVCAFCRKSARQIERAIVETEIPSITRVDDIQEKLEGLKGARLKVKANMGRSRIIERTGTLVNLFPSLFVVEVDERRGRKARQSYQYVDILTGTVELFEAETGEKLFDFAPAEEDAEGEDEFGEDDEDEA